MALAPPGGRAGVGVARGLSLFNHDGRRNRMRRFLNVFAALCIGLGSLYSHAQTPNQF